jgi:hypothetical protein
MNERELIPLTSYDQEPEGMTEAEAREFWDTHAITEEYLATMPPVSEEDFPPVRPERPHGRPKLPPDVMRRLKQIAWQRKMNVDVLIQELIESGLAAEEAREKDTARRSG